MFSFDDEVVAKSMLKSMLSVLAIILLLSGLLWLIVDVVLPTLASVVSFAFHLLISVVGYLLIPALLVYAVISFYKKKRRYS